MRFTTVMALLSVASLDIAQGINLDNEMDIYADPSANELLEEHIEDTEQFPEENEDVEIAEEQLLKSTPQEDEDSLVEEDAEEEYETDEEQI